jgi:hypothetical protein
MLSDIMIFNLSIYFIKERKNQTKEQHKSYETPNAQQELKY